MSAVVVSGRMFVFKCLQIAISNAILVELYFFLLYFISYIMFDKNMGFQSSCVWYSKSAAYLFDCAALVCVSSLNNQKKEEAKADVLGEKIKNNKGFLYL